MANSFDISLLKYTFIYSVSLSNRPSGFKVQLYNHMWRAFVIYSWRRQGWNMHSYAVSLWQIDLAETRLKYVFICTVSWTNRSSGAHSSRSQTTADILQLECSPQLLSRGSWFHRRNTTNLLLRCGEMDQNNLSQKRVRISSRVRYIQLPLNIFGEGKNSFLLFSAIKWYLYFGKKIVNTIFTSNKFLL